MALNLVCAVLDRGPQDLAEMAVLLAIADSADKDSGEAWPSQATIARRARQTERSVRNVLARLRDAGWLTWAPRQRGNGSRASNVYSLNLAMLGEARERGACSSAARNPVPGTSRNSVPGGSGTPFRGASEPRSGHAPEPRSALEPSQNKEPCATVEKRRAAVRSALPPDGASRPGLTGATGQAIVGRPARGAGFAPVVAAVDPWAKAAAAAAMGLQWCHPATLDWFPASAFAEKRGAA